MFSPLKLFNKRIYATKYIRNLAIESKKAIIPPILPPDNKRNMLRNSIIICGIIISIWIYLKPKVDYFDTDDNVIIDATGARKK